MPYKLSEFETGYVTAMLWSSFNYGKDPEGEYDVPLDDTHGIFDLSSEALATVRADCAAFLTRANTVDLGVAVMSQHGHDFWLTRCGHGAGFWDRGYPGKTGDRLSTLAQSFGEAYPSVDDTGKVCF